MEFSAWKIWLHPRLSRRVFEELSEAAETSESLCERLHREKRELEELKLRREEEALKLEELKLHLEEEKLRLEEEKLKLRNRVEYLESRNGELQTELENRVDADTRIRAFEKQLEGFQEVKRQYENRIERLRGEIIRLRGMRGPSAPINSDIGEIDMTTGAVRRMGASKRKPEPPKTDDSDWLKDLPL